MSGGKHVGGYTIVEVLIFLGVSGVLFLMAMVTINGKQSQAEFAKSVRNFQSRISDLLNDVATGYYPNQRIQCELSGGQGSQVRFVSGTKSPGTNEPCIFIGKVLQFNSSSNEFNIISVAGTRINSNGLESSSLTEARPKAIVDATTTPQTDLTAKEAVENNLAVTDIITTAASATRPGAIGFFTSFPKYNGSSVSGAPSTNTIAIPNTLLTDSLDAPYTSVVSQINNLNSLNPPLNPTIVLCVAQGGLGSNGRRAAIIIGRNSRGVTTELHIDTHTTAVPAATGGTSCTFG